MKCPTCPDATLVITERSGIEIDYCPTCRGVWLDRGELDKIIERSTVSPSPNPPLPGPTEDRYRDRHDRDDEWFDDDGGRHRGHDHDTPHDGRRRPKRRRESFLGDLFDF